MVNANLASMSVEALLQLRDNVERILSRKADELQQQLATLGDGGWIALGKKMAGRPRGSSLKGRKVAPKYRNPKNRSETWAGRGAMPRWLAAEIKQGKKRDDFAINKAAAKAKRDSGQKVWAQKEVTGRTSVCRANVALNYTGTSKNSCFRRAMRISCMRA